MTWERPHESREGYLANSTHWNESRASGKMHRKRIEGVSKLLGLPSRPGDGGTSLVNEGPSLPSRQVWNTRPACAKENHGTIVPGLSESQQRRRPVIGSPGKLGRSCCPRPLKLAPRGRLEYHTASEKHELDWLLPVDPLSGQ